MKKRKPLKQANILEQMSGYTHCVPSHTMDTTWEHKDGAVETVVTWEGLTKLCQVSKVQLMAIGFANPLWVRGQGRGCSGPEDTVRPLPQILVLVVVT